MQRETSMQMLDIDIQQHLVGHMAHHLHTDTGT
jgi:hypothetical protein